MVESPDSADRSWRAWYAVLTMLLGGPLSLALLMDRPHYPVAVWSLFSGTASLDQSTEYQVVVGELVDGTERPIRGLIFNNALTSRIGSLVGYAALNRSVLIRNPHPANQRLIDSVGGPEGLPIGARVPELLRAWGDIYNQRLGANSAQRLRALRIEERLWPGGRYENFSVPVRSWRVEVHR